MDGFDLLAVDQQRQVQVDGLLDRFFSLAKNRTSAFGPTHAEQSQFAKPRIASALRQELHPVANTIFDRVG
jgi:hypothetical protein